jgi:hypothetical protein
MAKTRRKDDGPEQPGSGDPQGDAGRDRVEMRAYELYLERGGGDGRAMDDWLTAERELMERQKQQRTDER